MMPPNSAQEHPEPSAPPPPPVLRLPVARVNGTYPPLPSVPASVPASVPFPFPRATQPDSPREQPKYFASRSEAGTPIDNRRTSFASSDVSSTSYRPGRSNPGPIKSEPLPSMEVTVADPRVCHEPHKVAVPGFHRKYIKYTVTTGTDLKTFGYSPVQVVRRFSDFVALENLLKATHRGFFVPPRPFKYAAQGGKLRPQFIEQRRAALQQYLTSLCTHRVIARSAELRIFLEERGELSNSQTWLALHSPTPTWIQGVQRLLKQIVGKQAITPAPSEAARATTASHDVVRSVREALHSYRSKQDINLPDREQEVRRRSDLVRVLVSSVNGIAHATSAAQRLANERLNVAGGLGRTFMHLAAFEAATAHPLEADEAEKFGNGCQTVCTSAREEMTPAVASCKELEEQARMLGGALTALSARDEALRTARTLDDDLGRLRARAESMQASGHTKALAALQNLALAEAAQAAAWNEYDTVALRNEHDIQDCASKSVGEAQHKVLVWAESQASAGDCESAAWLRVARSLGADPAAVTDLED